MAERNERGHFLPGNKISKLGGRAPDGYNDKKKCREEIIKCALSLSLPLATLEKEITNPNATRLEYLTAYAVSKKNYKFIQWLLEMAVGKATQTFDVEDMQGLPHVTISIPDNSKAKK